jgi:hypothetical protein
MTIASYHMARERWRPVLCATVEQSTRRIQPAKHGCIPNTTLPSSPSATRPRHSAVTILHRSGPAATPSAVPPRLAGRGRGGAGRLPIPNEGPGAGGPGAATLGAAGAPECSRPLQGGPGPVANQGAARRRGGRLGKLRPQWQGPFMAATLAGRRDPMRIR